MRAAGVRSLTFVLRVSYARGGGSAQAARMLHTHTPYRLLSDERLARLAAGRDDRAFSSLYQRHEAALLAYCRSITRDPEDARDALQSAMASAYSAIPGRRPGGPVRAWLFKITHNEAIDLLRRRRHELPLVDGDLSPAPSAADQTTAREAAHEALAEVADLPPRQRGALVLRELHGLAYDEIAAALSVTEVNARQLVFAARSGVADSRAGRNLPCEFVRDAIEAGDRRAQRRRPLRAHLRSCDDCRAFARVSRPVGRRAVLALPGGWIAGWTQALGGGGASLTTSAGELAAPAKGVAVVAVAAAVAAATASHDGERAQPAKAPIARLTAANSRPAPKTPRRIAPAQPPRSIAPTRSARAPRATSPAVARQSPAPTVVVSQPLPAAAPPRTEAREVRTAPHRVAASPRRHDAPQLVAREPSPERTPTINADWDSGSHHHDRAPLGGNSPDGGERAAWRDCDQADRTAASSPPADPESAPAGQTVL